MRVTRVLTRNVLGAVLLSVIYITMATNGRVIAHTPYRAGVRAGEWIRYIATNNLTGNCYWIELDIEAVNGSTVTFNIKSNTTDQAVNGTYDENVAVNCIPSQNVTLPFIVPAQLSSGDVFTVQGGNEQVDNVEQYLGREAAHRNEFFTSGDWHDMYWDLEKGVLLGITGYYHSALVSVDVDSTNMWGTQPSTGTGPNWGFWIPIIAIPVGVTITVSSVFLALRRKKRSKKVLDNSAHY
jgi:hypothetical protein